MKFFLSFIFILSCLFANAQSIQTLETNFYKLEYIDSIGIRNNAKQLLKIDSLNRLAIYFIVNSYKENKDSIDLFFDNLKKLHPNNSIPYILCAYHKYDFRNLSEKDTSIINELLIAKSLDTLNTEVTYSLAKIYYDYFMLGIKNNSFKTTYFCSKSREYFIKTFNLKPYYIENLKYPIIHLSYYLKDTNDLTKYRNCKSEIFVDNNNIPIVDSLMLIKKHIGFIDDYIKTIYFPINNFIGLPVNWEHDFKCDVLHKLSCAYMQLYYLSDLMLTFKEEMLYKYFEKQKFRFLYLRSLHHSILFNLEKAGDDYLFTYKELEYKQGVIGSQHIKSYSKKISKKKWEEFLQLIEKANFWETQTYEEIYGTDGTDWIIEGCMNGKYNVVRRWCPGNSNFAKCGLFLLELSGIKPDC